MTTEAERFEGNVSAHRAGTKGKIMLGNPDGTPFDKQAWLTEGQSVGTEEAEVLKVMDKADKQAKLGAIARRASVEELALRADVTQDELDSLYEANKV